jgi:hypothetical protein
LVLGFRIVEFNICKLHQFINNNHWAHLADVGINRWQIHLLRDFSSLKKEHVPKD